MRLRCIRFVLGFAVPSVVLGVASSPAPAAAAAPSINCPYSSSNDGVVDFDGDGIADMVAQAPGADNGAGAVEVRFNRGSRTATFAPGDGVLPAAGGGGPAVSFATFNFNYDACTDLVIGLPTYSVGNVTAAGAVQILYGSKTGFVTGPLITPNSSGLPGSAQPGEHFGAALAGVGNQLTVGAPGWSPEEGGAGATARAGEAMVMSVTTDSNGSAQEYGVFPLRKTNPHAGDALGSTVAIRVAGAPNARAHGHAGAGCFVWGWAADSEVTYCGHHTRDLLGASFAVTGSSTKPAMYVGSPGHEVTVKVAKRHGKKAGAKHSETLTAAGAVEKFALGREGSGPQVSLQDIITQATRGVPGRPTPGNHFGQAVATYLGAKPLLAVGVPGESPPGAKHAGAVLVRQGDTTSSPWQLVDRAIKGVAGVAREADHFGQAVTLTARGYPGADDDYLLVVGVPGEDRSGMANAGRVQVFPNHGTKVAVNNSQLVGRGSRSAAHDLYGSAVL